MIFNPANKMIHTLSKIIRKPTDRVLLTLWKLKSLKNRERFKIRISKILGYSVQYPDQISLYFEFKDIFKNKIYYFNTKKKTPFIIDAGSCIGMSILYFKYVYPDARIIGFEPDREIFTILQNNIKRNNLTNVEAINAALASREGELVFFPDGTDGGSLVFDSNKEPTKVKAVRLSDYINEPVDFLKMNIEGAELDVLTEISDKLHYINEMVIEYHSFDNSNQVLHCILDLLNRNGFMYLINDFDGETNPAVRTPFKLGENTRYFLLIYAKRKEAVHDNT
jgi:FkbM family methyltransferase